MTAPYRGPVAIPPAGACPDRVRLLAFAADVPLSGQAPAEMRRALAHYRPSEQALAVRLTARGMTGERHAVPLAARRALAEAGFHIEEEELNRDCG